jgi:uncharacterized protein
MEPVPARIFLRPIGSPLTIGMSGLAIASFVQSGFDLHWVASDQAVQIGLALVAAPFILQLIACVFSYLARDGAAGATLGVLATSWLVIGLAHITSPSSRTSGGLGLTLIAAAAVITLSALSVATGKPMVGLVFLLAALRAGTSAVYELSTVSFWQDVAGIVGLVTMGLAMYCVLAFELEGQKRGPVLPTMRRGRASLAVSNGTAAQLEGVAHEAGVRQTS